MKKEVRTKAQMYPIISGFSKSGMTSKSYAALHGLNYGVYKYWLRKYNIDKKQQASTVSSDFIPVAFTPASNITSRLEISYPNGVRVSVSTALDAQGIKTLKQLILCLD